MDEEHESVKYVWNAPPWWSFSLNSSKGARDIEQPPFWTILEAGWPPNLYSISKMLPIGEVLVQIGQPGAEILSSLHFVLLSLFPQYLRGCLSFGGYFFTEEEHFYRYIDMWLKIGQKGLFRGLASMEVGWPKSWWALEDGKKCST